MSLFLLPFWISFYVRNFHALFLVPFSLVTCSSNQFHSEKKNGIERQSVLVFAPSAAGHGGQQRLASFGGVHPAGGGGGGRWGVRRRILLRPQRGGCGHSLQLREYIGFYISFLIRFFFLKSVSDLDFEVFMVSEFVSMTWYFLLVGSHFCASLLNRIFCGVEKIFFILLSWNFCSPFNCVFFLFCWNSLDLVRTYFTVLHLWEAGFDLLE